MSVEERFTRLERRCRALTLAVMGLLALLAVTLLCGASSDVRFGKVTCNYLSVVNEDGTEMIRAMADRGGASIRLAHPDAPKEQGINKGQIVLLVTDNMNWVMVHGEGGGASLTGRPDISCGATRVGPDGKRQATNVIPDGVKTVNE